MRSNLTALRKLPSVVLSLVAVVFLSACLPGAGTTIGSTGPSVNTSAPIPVALLVPHGAASAGEQQLARDLENAARLAIADLQGVQIDLRVYGTAGSVPQAQQAAANAVADGAKIIVGPLRAEAANAAAVTVAPQNVNVLAFSNNPTIAGGNLFVLGQTFNNTADRLIKFAQRNNRSRVITVYADNVAGQLGKAAIETAIASNGATAAGSVGYEFSQAGVVSAIQKIKSAAEASNADAVFMTANAAGALPLLTQLLPEAGLTKDQIKYIGLSRWDTPPQTLELPGVQEGWFALPDPVRSKAFRDRFEAANGNRPHILSGLAYDAIAAIGALVAQGNRDALSASALTQSAGFQGVNGVFRLRPDGTNERGLAVATIREKQIFVLDPAPQGFSGAGF